MLAINCIALINFVNICKILYANVYENFIYKTFYTVHDKFLQKDNISKNVEET